MNKKELHKAMIENMPDFISDNIKEDIANIMMKIMEAIDGESTMGIVIALDVLKDMYLQNLSETIKEKFGEDSDIHKMVKAAALMSEDIPGTIH